MSIKQILYIALVAVLIGISAFAGAAGGAYAIYRLEHQKLATALQDIQAQVDTLSSQAGVASSAGTLVVENTDVQTTITQVAQQVGPAVVTVVGTVQVQVTFFGYSNSEVSGSGVFVSDDGYVLTNYHVVEDTTELWVILADGSRREATLVGGDVYADIAVLKTEGKAPATAMLGNSDAIDRGETVIAIGSPLGDFTNSVTVGVVSATGRSIDTGRGYKILDLIQTDAAINEGNSGGPLVNLAGQVVGINTLVVRSSNSGAVAEGLGFAIPANTVQAVAQQIIETGRFSRPYLGISWQAISPYLARRYRLPVEWGVYITAVEPGSPADQADLQPGDIIVQIGETQLDETHSYINALFQYQPGDQVPLKLVRNGEAVEIQVTLGES